MRKITIILTLICFACIAKAQSASMDTTIIVSDDKYKVETNHFWNNWFVSGGVGVQMLFGDHNKQMQIKDRFTMAYDFAFGKWFSPGLGVRAGVSGYKLNGVSGWSNHSATEMPNVNWYNYMEFIKNAYFDEVAKHWAGDIYKSPKDPNHYTLYQTEIKYLNTHVDAMFNLTNIFLGYSEDHIYNFIPYIGVGWATTLNDGIYYDNKLHQLVKGQRSNEVSANIGLLNELKLNKNLWLSLDIRGAYVNDRFDSQIGGRWGEGILSGTLGLTYKFNQSGWDKSKTIVIRQSEKELNELRNRLREIEEANRDLQNKLNAKPESIKEIKESIIAGPLLVTFIINKADLSNEAKVNLGFLAEAIKKNPQATFVVTGYADKGTGNASINERLSKRRAEAVYNCLVNEFGVSPSQIRAEYKGGVDNMYYNDPRVSRAVITRIE